MYRMIGIDRSISLSSWHPQNTTRQESFIHQPCTRLGVIPRQQNGVPVLCVVQQPIVSTAAVVSISLLPGASYHTARMIWLSTAVRTKLIYTAVLIVGVWLDWSTTKINAARSWNMNHLTRLIGYCETESCEWVALAAQHRTVFVYWPTQPAVIDVSRCAHARLGTTSTSTCSEWIGAMNTANAQGRRNATCQH